MRATFVAISVSGLSFLSLAACRGESVDDASTYDSGEINAEEAAVKAPKNLGVSCSPAVAYAYPGDRLLLRSNVRGSLNKEVTWSVTNGDIDENTIFTAPEAVGDATITATAVADGRSSAKCVIHVIERAHPRDTGAGSEVSVHTTLGLPGPVDESAQHRLVRRPSYVLSYNSERKTANWASWQLDGTYIGGAIRSQTWRTDPDITSAQAVDKDYTNSGYDRGHLCPSGDRTRLDEVNRTTFMLSNALPQAHNVNAGPWQKLEESLQKRAERGQQIFIIAGGVFDDHGGTIGSGVAIPSATWKVAVVLEHIGQGAADVVESAQVIAVLMPNDDASTTLDDDWRKYQVRVDDIENITSLDLLSDLDPSLQAILEERVEVVN
jgi:endonuclease G, mitochondrial